MKAKLSILTFLFSTISLLINAQNYGFEWAKGAARSSTLNQGKSIITDDQGNVYSVGMFKGIVDFDPSSGVHNLISQVGTDLFIQKLDSIGNLLWVKQVRTNDTIVAASINIDNWGNIIVSGYFHGIIDLDPGAAAFNLTSVGYHDTFIQKLDSSGNFLWGKHIKGVDETFAFSSTLDSDGNIYTVGRFAGNIDFDPGVNDFYLSTQNSWSAYILKLDSLGDFIWAKDIGGNGHVRGYTVTVDPYDNVYLAGDFWGTADFNPNSGTKFLTTTNPNGYVLKLSSNGAFQWVRQMEGIGSAWVSAVESGPFGGVYLTGTFDGTVDFHSGQGVNVLTSSNFGDSYLLKFDWSGNFIWVKQFGISGRVASNDLTVGSNGNIYLTGLLYHNPDFDPDTNNYVLSSNGEADIFVSGYDLFGGLLFAKQIGGSFIDYGYAISIDNNDNIYTIGQFLDTVDFNYGIGNTNLFNFGLSDTYIMKMSPCESLSSLDVRNECSPFVWIDGNTYMTDNDSAIYTLYGQGSNGCDSIIFLDLTIIGQTIHKTDTIVACSSYTWIDGNTYTSNNNTATHTFHGVTSSGCDSIVTLDLSINNITDKSTSVVGNTIIANNNNASYQWLDCLDSNSLIIGEINQVFTVISNGEYAVELTENGCVDTSTCVLINNVGLDEKESLSDVFSIYPNPTDGEFYIEFETNISSYEIFIKDIGGRLIHHTFMSNTRSNEIKLNQSPGVYYITVKTTKDLTTVPLIIK